MIVEPQPAVGLERAPSLPDGWRLVRFDQMAECVTDRVDNPADAGVERYVGLEHLAPESLRIRRWGSPTDVEATKLRFKAGDIIFGRRRAYQHKLAVADFEGICSAHAMVLRAREAVALKEFLPLLMQSDLFFDRALAISVGSLSPTINWRTLARQEFPLPPKDEQHRIAEILWAADEAIERYAEAIAAAEGLRRAVVGRFLERGTFPMVPLGSVGRWLSGGTPSRAVKDYWNGGFPWASPKDIKTDILEATTETISEEALGTLSTIASVGAILIVVRGMILAHSFPIAMTARPMAFNQDIKALVPSPEFRPGFVFNCLKHQARRCLALASDSSHGTKRVTTSVLQSLEVPRPTLEEQDGTLSVLAALDRQIGALRNEWGLLSNAFRSLRESLLRMGSRGDV